MDADALWSVYDTKFLSHNIAANLWDLRGDRLALEYRYTRESDEISIEPGPVPFRGFTCKGDGQAHRFADYEYNFLDNTRGPNRFRDELQSPVLVI